METQHESALPAPTLKPTAEELFQFLEIDLPPRRRVWRRYRTLRRAGMGQTRALIGALVAAGVPLFRIALALRCSDCSVKRHWRQIRELCLPKTCPSRDR